MSLSGLFSLKPHGDRLLTPSASMWLVSVRMMVFIMAGIEACGWGSVGYMFGQGALSWLLASGVALTTFVVIWIVDTSFVTLDRAWTEHSHSLLGLSTPKRQRAIQDGAAVALRVGLVAASLLTTAPYLAQLVFRDDIAQFHEQTAARSINEARENILKGHAQHAEVARREVGQQRRLYELETAGKGASGRHGEGPAARSLQEGLRKLELELSATLAGHASDLSNFNAAAQDWQPNRDLLVARYGVRLPAMSLAANRKALMELRQRPEVQAVELAIQVALLVVFVGLMLLKFLEPRSVRLYFSEILQQEFIRYRAGAFDEALAGGERSTDVPNSMTGERLYEYLSTVWRAAKQHQGRESKQLAERLAISDGLEVLERMRKGVIDELNAQTIEAAELARQHDAASDRLGGLRSAVSVVKNDIQEIQLKLDKVEANEGGLREEERLRLLSHLSQRLLEANRACRELEEAVPTETERQRRTSAAVAAARGRQGEIRRELQAREQELSQLRSHLAATAGRIPLTLAS